MMAYYRTVDMGQCARAMISAWPWSHDALAVASHLGTFLLRMCVQMHAAVMPCIDSKQYHFQ